MLSDSVRVFALVCAVCACVVSVACDCSSYVIVHVCEYDADMD